MNEKSENKEEIAEKLDILIKLTASNIIKEEKSQTDSIVKLKKIGIANKDIAKITDTSQNYVNMVLSRNKRKEEPKEKKETENDAE